MKDINEIISYKDKEFRLVFNLNVMEEIQAEYGSLEKWGELTDGSAAGEPDAKAVIFGFAAMLNEGIDMTNEETGAEEKPLTLKQVGRIITEVGLANATQILNNTVVESTESAEKNASSTRRKKSTR